MAFGEVIDLLSSDDEAPLRPSSKEVDVTFTSAHEQSEFLDLSDHFDGTVPFSDEWVAGPSAKRRKLSLPRHKDKGMSMRPQSPHIKRNTLQTNNVRQTSQESQVLDEHDPIVFTSSLGTGQAERLSLHGNESDDSLPDNLLSITQRHTKAAPALSERTAALLEVLSLPASHPKPATARQRSRDKASAETQISSEGCEDHVGGPSKSLKVVVRNTKLTEEEKVAKARGKEQERAVKAREKDNAKAAIKEQRASEKEKDQEKKRQLKEEKAREKRIAADLAEVNKVKLDKKDSTPEMIVDLPATIEGQSVGSQIREFVKNLGVDATLYQSPIPNVIKWRRKMKARWNAEMNHWEPTDRMEIHEEKHVMVLVSAKEFVALAMAQYQNNDLETHVAMLKSAYADCIPIYMVEGLHIWLRKNKTAENRAYQARVLDQAQAAEDLSLSQPAASKRKKSAPEVVDEDLIEDALLRLQVMHGCLVHHTNTSVETAEWVANFTQHISTIPYRLQRMNLDTSFCMESGQVKTGEDKDDTFVKMLQEVVRITPSIAYGITSEYTSAISLVKAFRKHGRDVLEDLQKAANRNGAPTDRRIGPAISRRLYKVFTELDPGSTDV
ncbi:crossover junction endonuclease EME1, partial [Lecanoromycetidae sp. Uapishka_2]